MSLKMLLDEDTCNEMMTSWPTKPAIYELPADSRLPDIANAQLSAPTSTPARCPPTRSS